MQPGWSDLALLPDSVVLLTDTIDASADALLVQLIQFPTQLVLVSFRHTFHHFAAIARKLGLNLSSKRAEKQLIFIDGLTSDCVRNNSDERADAYISATMSCELLEDIIQGCIYRVDPEQLKTWTVIIDGLDSLCLLGVTLKEDLVALIRNIMDKVTRLFDRGWITCHFL